MRGGVGRWWWFMCLWNPGMGNPRAGVCGSLSLGYPKVPHKTSTHRDSNSLSTHWSVSALLCFCSSETQPSPSSSPPQADLALGLGGASLELGVTSHPAPQGSVRLSCFVDSRSQETQARALSHPAPGALIHGGGPCRGLTPAINFLLL